MFNNNSRILAIKPSGNVFAAEAVEELNYKAKSWNDLLTGEEFTKRVRFCFRGQGLGPPKCSQRALLFETFVVRGEGGRSGKR